MNFDKLTPSLVAQLAKVGSGDILDIVLELDLPSETPEPGKSQQERRELRKEQFSQKMVPIRDKIMQVGGQVLGDAWINHTVRARVPADGVPHLTDLKSVERVDVPHAIELDKS